MSRTKVSEYYRDTRHSSIRPELTFAIEQVNGKRVAVDCGCGSGANIEHLRKEGFVVHAYDIDEEAVSICSERFKDDPDVSVSLASFGSFQYPNSSLILADASLFFCPRSEFNPFLEKSRKSLIPDGVFYSAFLGSEDTMAQPACRDLVYWGVPLIKSEREIRKALFGFEILDISEIKIDGTNSTGEAHRWHMHIVVARVV